MATDFSGYQSALVKNVGGFGGPKAQMWFGFTGRYKDAELDLLRTWKTTERYPEACGEDALPYVASTFDITRLDADTAATWRARIQTCWAEIHKLSGSAPCVTTMLEATGATNVVITERWQVDPTDENYSKTEFEVEVAGWAVTVLGAGLILPFILGSDIQLAHVREMVRIILKYKSAHCLPHYLTVADGIGGEADYPIYIMLGDPECVLGEVRLGAPVEY